MKYIVSLLLLLASLIPLQAADGIKTVLLTANTVSNLLSGPYIVNNITILATTTNVTTVKIGRAHV